MTVSEVREVMRRSWAKNSDILSLMYAQDPRLRLFGFGGRAAPSSPTFAAAYKMFFLQVVPVAPNRVRPPSFIGDNTFEHPHNIALTRVRNVLRPGPYVAPRHCQHIQAPCALLGQCGAARTDCVHSWAVLLQACLLKRELRTGSQIINANLELVSRAAEPAAAAEVIEENRALVRQLDLAASLRIWLALQGHVNTLLDSTTAGPAAKGDVQARSHVLFWLQKRGQKRGLRALTAYPLVLIYAYRVQVWIL